MERALAAAYRYRATEGRKRKWSAAGTACSLPAGDWRSPRSRRSVTETEGSMSRELDFLAREAVRGRLTRREFLGRAAALGLTLPAATKLLSSTALAQGPQKGGDLLVGLVGGESTNSLDPARAADAGAAGLHQVLGRDAGLRRARGQLGDADAGGIVGSFRRRQGMALQDPQGRDLPRRQGADRRTTWWRR